MDVRPSRRQVLKAGGLALGATALSGTGLPAPASAAEPPVSASAAEAPGPGAGHLDYRFRDDTADAAARLNDLVRRLTLEEKIAIATGNAPDGVPRLGLNAGRVAGYEGLHGVQGGGKATVFPSPLGGSQSWHPQLFHDLGNVIAREALADNGGIALLAPVMDLLHDPRAGRNYETMGEDAYLSGTLGAAMASGMNQRNSDGYQRLLPILKHFLGYNNEINRLWTNTVMPPRVAREYYVRTFRYPIAAGGAKGVMTSYPLVNGKPMSVNPVLREMLDEWTPDYPGTGHDEFFTINDYGSGSSLWVHSGRYFPDDPDGRAMGSAQGLRNGQMSWSFRDYGDPVSQIYDALARGLLTEERIEAGARRNLATSLRLGDLDHLRIRNPHTAATAVPRASLLAGHAAVAFTAAREQIVLLKNDDQTLPLRGATTRSVVLLGSMAEEVLKDQYTGDWVYAIALRDALANKLGSGNVYFSRAVDQVAIKASNGGYLASANNTDYREPGTAAAADTPVLATGVAAHPDRVTPAETALLFEIYDYGGPDRLLRTPINDRFLQVPHLLAAAAHRGTLINNTSAPGTGSLTTGGTQYVNYQKFRIVPADDGRYGIYHPVAGNGGNNSYGQSAMAYDQDDEDLNNGSYLRLVTSGDQANQIVADTGPGRVGPYRAERHQIGPSITATTFDRGDQDGVVDRLPEEYRFDLQSVRSSDQAIDAALAAAPADAPVLLVVGYEPHLTAREAVDLTSTGLSAQQSRNLDHLTRTRQRDVILIIKTGSPMTIDQRVHDNPRVKAIIEIGHSAQEEGSALVSALFDDGYAVPARGFAPAADRYAPFAAYPAYPGYLGADGTVPGYGPAGRLTATWYRRIADLPGASDDHPPASYRWPRYDEASNDNLGNLNGTIPTGLLTYDIIKGQRTYQYFTGTPLYPFGYGLTYPAFEYSALRVSRIEDGGFTVSGRVTNTGDRRSDEVVQIYARFTGKPSRIAQPVNRLIAFDRLPGLSPGETRAFHFDVDARDTLAVWDVETGRYLVEPGSYQIRAARHAADPGTTATLTVTAATGGTPAARRDLNRLTLAENFDDYSDVADRMADLELVSASNGYHSNTAVLLRQDGAWIVFKDVAVPAGTASLTVRVGSDRSGVLDVYAVPPGAAPETLPGARPVAVFPLTDTRPVPGLPTGLGTGPIAVTGQPYRNRPYPGSPAGQHGLDANGQPYRDAYVTPGWRTTATGVTLAPGRYDVYLRTERRGARIEWLAFGAKPATTSRIEIVPAGPVDSIRASGGTLALAAELTPDTSVSPVTWSVSDPRGKPTPIATIGRDTGVLQATGTGNGLVLVTATSGRGRASRQILVTNQRERDQVTIAGVPKTVDHIILRTGTDFGGTDNIQRLRGGNQQTAIFSGRFGEHPDGYFPSGEYQTLPASALEWRVTGSDGLATGLATVDAGGLVVATGEGDGDVVVTATLRSNPDLVGRRVIRIRNQAAKPGYRMIQAENYDASTARVSAAATWGPGGNEFGLRVPMPAGSAWTYARVDFGPSAPRQVSVRLASDTRDVTIEVWADAATAGAGGTPLATVRAATAGSAVTYATFSAPITAPLRGVHDVILKPAVATHVNWFVFGPPA